MSEVKHLVTGGAGFIGSHLVDALLERGDEVTVLDDLSTGKAGNIARHDRRPGFRLVRGDVLDAGLVDELVEQHGHVYHLAAAVGVKHIMEDPVGSALTNVRGTENVLASAHRHRVPILLASTSEEEISILDLAERIRAIVGSSSRVEHVGYETYYGPGFEDTRRRVPDVRRAREQLGFEARIPLREGLERTLEWCRTHYALRA